MEFKRRLLPRNGRITEHLSIKKGLPLVLRFSSRGVKKTAYALCLAAVGIFSLVRFCFAEQSKALPEFTKDDRVLILAPHPDDEAIGTAGVIQEAFQAGSRVKVVLFTNGDNNELAFIVYEKRLTFRKGEFIHMGEVRAKESLAAMRSLGLNQEDIVLFGYPDFGTLEIMTKYWGDTRPFRSMLTRVTKVSYPEAMSPNAPYVGESILKDLKSIISDFRPTIIFVSHPADVNRDHRALYLFLRVALWDLEGHIHRPAVFPYLIHVVHWPLPRGYHPDLELIPPHNLSDSEMVWQRLDLTEEEVKKKHDAIACYKSQIEYSPPYLFTFARKNELFGGLAPIGLKRQAEGDINWRDIGVPQTPESLEGERKREGGFISNLAYAYQSTDLFIKLTLRKALDKDFGISVFLLGYSKGTDFARMPKIHISVNLLGLRVKDKRQPLSIKGVALNNQGRVLIMKVPLTLLGNPDYILSCARTQVSDLPFSETAWRVLELE